MSGGQIARLRRRGVVAVGGAEAEPFLNDLVTADITTAAPGQAVYAALLSPQGKVLFDFVVFRAGGTFFCDVAKAGVADLVKRLAFYRLRAKVAIDDVTGERRVLAAWGNGEPLLDGIVAPDPRLPALGWRAIVKVDGPSPAGFIETSENEYDAHRIRLGVPEGGIDFAFGEVFPHDVDIDQFGGIDRSKGCYIGQEVVSRMEHRGTARRRIVIAEGSAPLPGAGTPINADGRPIGTLMSSTDRTGLAMVRLDRAKEAMDAGLPIVAGQSSITLTLPPWAKFGWPAAGKG